MIFLYFAFVFWTEGRDPIIMALVKIIIFWMADNKMDDFRGLGFMYKTWN